MADVREWMLPRPCRVARVRRESHDTVTLFLDPADEPTAGMPGQFNMLYAFGVGEVPISIAGRRRNGGVVHTVRSVGAVSRAISRARPGVVLGVRGPFGTPWPLVEAEGRDLVLVAGGIGLAPLRSVIEAVLRARRRYGRVVLAYGARSPRELIFGRELERWRARGDLVVDVTVDTADPAWRGSVGFVTRRLARLPFDPGAVALLCGPEVMMRAAAGVLAERGVREDRMFVSNERNMKCGIGLCGHCQLASEFICREGPVFRYDRIAPLLGIREL